MTLLGLRLESAKAAHCEAISRTLKKTKTDGYLYGSGGEEQRGIEVVCRAKVIEKWYIGTLSSSNFTN